MENDKPVTKWNLIVETLLMVVVLLIVVMVGFLVITKMGIDIKNQITYCACCGGKSCKDTYFDANRSICVNSVGASVDEYVPTNVSSCDINLRV